MEQKPPPHYQGYQKQIKKPTPPPASARKKEVHYYSSAIAHKIPQFLEAIKSGDLIAVQKFINERLNVNISRDGVTPLMVAVSQGHVAIVEAILQSGANVNIKSEDGWTALHKAAFDQADTDIVELLMSSGVDIEAKNKAGKTALQLAEESKHRDIARAIKKHQQQLQHDAQEWIEFLDTPEGKPYKLSRRYKALSLLFTLWWMPVLILGCGGFFLGQILGDGLLPVIIGVVIGTVISLSLNITGQMLRSYLEVREPLPYLDIHIVREKRMAGEPIIVAVREKTKRAEDAVNVETGPRASATMLSVEESADGPHQERARDEKVSDPIRTIDLNRAAYVIVALMVFLFAGVLFMRRGDLAHWYYEKKLERGGITVSEKSFLTAVSNNNEESINLFIRAGISLSSKNEKGQTALIIASEKGHRNLVVKLLEMDGALLHQYDNSGISALMTAAYQGHEDVVQALCESGGDVNYRAPSKEGAATALQAAVDAADFNDEHMRIIQYLLSHGADVKGRNGAGWSPLLFATGRDRLEAAKALIASGADVNGADNNGIFPLMIAACKGYRGSIELLAEKGANMNMASTDGQTPLMCASAGGHGEAVNLLLGKGAQINAKTVNGSTALTDATRAGNVEIAKILLARGADPSRRYVPDAFTRMKGKAVVLSAKKKKISDVLGTLAKTASQEGYTLHYDVRTMGQNISVAKKGPWNKLLNDLATKNRFVLLVKDKAIFVLP